MDREDEARRWLDIASELLQAKEYTESKQFAERAMDVYPLLSGLDEIIAVADVLLASQLRINNQHDWYSILQLNPTSCLDDDFSTVKHAYRRIALLLRPDRNRYSGADLAFKLVSDAWFVLSDPNRKRLYDDEIRIATAQSNGSKTPSEKQVPPTSFWTLCPTCFRAYEYEKLYLNRNIRCLCCQRVFQAMELPLPPPIVKGADMYYCAWGLFPLGFPGCPVFNGVNIPEGALQVRMYPEHLYGKAVEDPANRKNAEGNSVNGNATDSLNPVKKQKKVLAKKPRRGSPSVMEDDDEKSDEFGAGCVPEC